MYLKLSEATTYCYSKKPVTEKIVDNRNIIMVSQENKTST